MSFDQNPTIVKTSFGNINVYYKDWGFILEFRDDKHWANSAQKFNEVGGCSEEYFDITDIENTLVSVDAHLVNRYKGIFIFVVDQLMNNDIYIKTKCRINAKKNRLQNERDRLAELNNQIRNTVNNIDDLTTEIKELETTAKKFQTKEV